VNRHFQKYKNNYSILNLIFIIFTTQIIFYKLYNFDGLILLNSSNHHLALIYYKFQTFTDLLFLVQKMKLLIHHLFEFRFRHINIFKTYHDHLFHNLLKKSDF